MLGDGIRRDFATISDEERTLFVNAVRKLDDSSSIFVYGKNGGHEGADANGDITYWDIQEQIHKDAHVHGINVHVGPGFIPWHRVIVNRLEGLLRLVDSRLSLHYWDWTTDPRVATGSRAKLFTPTCMGDDGSTGINRVPGDGGGDAGTPFRDFESTEGGGHNFIWRNVGAVAAKTSGEPDLDSDLTILSATNFTDFNNLLQGAHNVAHGYIGGTLSDAHFSFHDPFVFLLHSNLDRLWATWQRAPGHPDRLDPATAYGTILSDKGQPADYFDEWVQPWAGKARDGTVQTDLNPWKSDAAQQAHISYNAPSVIVPATYNTTVSPAVAAAPAAVNSSGANKPAGTHEPPNPIVTITVPPGSAGEVSLKKQLEPTQRAGLILAAIVGGVIGVVTFILLIEWWKSAPSIGVPLNLWTMDPAGKAVVVEVAREKAFVENMKSLSDIAVDRSLKVFDDIVGRVLLPVFTSILGYIFATKGGNSASGQDVK